MKAGTTIVLVLALSSLIVCWESNCRQEIIQDIQNNIATSYNKADINDTFKTAAANAKVAEVFDHYLNYNSDFSDRIGEDTSFDSFKKAETTPNLAASNFRLTVKTDGTQSEVTYFFVGNCCYNLNPCISLKIGYKSILTLPGDAGSPSDTQIAATYADSVAATLNGVLQAKLLSS